MTVPILTAERVRELRGEALRLRERIILIGIETHEYRESGLEADWALGRAAHEIANAAKHLVRLEEHLANIESDRRKQ